MNNIFIKVIQKLNGILSKIPKVTQLFNPSVSKYSVELEFQKKWAVEFRANPQKVLEYWIKYRCYNEINEICQITQNSKVLDVGCGISTVLHFISGEKYGIDPLADQYVQIYNYPKEIQIKKGFGEHIPFPDNNFDVVFCSNVIDHVSNPEKTIHEIWRVLKPNGFFILTVEIFQEKMVRNAAHPHSITKEDVNSLMKNGFQLNFERESPWIGLRNYLQGIKKNHHNELITVWKKELSRK